MALSWRFSADCILILKSMEVYGALWVVFRSFDTGWAICLDVDLSEVLVLLLKCLLRGIIFVWSVIVVTVAEGVVLVVTVWRKKGSINVSVALTRVIEFSSDIDWAFTIKFVQEVVIELFSVLVVIRWRYFELTLLTDV